MKTRALRFAYARVMKPVFFRFDPERVHDFVSSTGERLGRSRAGRSFVRKLLDYAHPSLETDVMGIHFRNPIGLSAGFDKDARLTAIIPSVGFGFMEAGSVTGEPCAGNPKPRLWRLPGPRSLLVYYGLANDGAEAIASRLADARRTEAAARGRGARFPEPAFPVGVSVAMTNCAANLDLDAAIADYCKAFRLIEPHAAYITVNVSCPNAQGGQPFTSSENLERLLAAIDRVPTSKPVCLKLSPDMSRADVDAALDIAANHRVHGIICTNLTKKRDAALDWPRDLPAVGGLSGALVRDASDLMLAHVYRRSAGQFAVIGVGGVFTAEDAYRKIRLGASLVQLITGMIFEGPQAIGEINRGLARLLARDGFARVSDAVGVDNMQLS